MEVSFFPSKFFFDFMAAVKFYFLEKSKNSLRTYVNHFMKVNRIYFHGSKHRGGGALKLALKLQLTVDVHQLP